jgi:hypothetical protein
MDNNTSVVVDGRKFVISYDGQSVVKVRQADAGDFDKALSLIDGILSKFRRSNPGSEWGCDGVGYVVEKQHGIAFRNKSGVGRRKFAEGLMSFLPAERR